MLPSGKFVLMSKVPGIGGTWYWCGNAIWSTAILDALISEVPAGSRPSRENEKWVSTDQINHNELMKTSRNKIK